MLSIKELKKLRKQLLITIKAYPKNKLDKIFYGDWTIREVVGHISAWDIYFTKLLKNLGKNIIKWGNINEFNKREVAKRKALNLEKLVKELEKVSEEFIKTYQALNYNLLNRKFWNKRKYTPKDILKIQIHHYESQIRQIEKRS